MFSLNKVTIQGLPALDGYCSGIGFLTPLEEHPQLDLLKRVLSDAVGDGSFTVAYCSYLAGSFEAMVLPMQLSNGDVVTTMLVGRNVSHAILAHELVHVKQMATGRLVTLHGKNMWEGETAHIVESISSVKDVLKYFNSPWEVEAYRASHNHTPVWSMVPFNIWYQFKKLDAILALKLKKLINKFDSNKENQNENAN